MAVHNDSSITSMTSLMASINTFLTTSGGIGATFEWDEDITPTGSAAAFSTGDLFVQFGWTTTTLTIFQSESHDGSAGGANPGDVSYDSEAIFPVAPTNAELWVFANETTTATDRYAHCVVEFNNDGRFLHFGFGQMRTADKFFGWSGGAYKYGWEVSAADANDPINGFHRFPLLDSLHIGTTTAQNLATMRASGLRGQDATSDYLGFTSSGTALPTDDSNGNPVSTGRSFGRYGPGPDLATFQDGSPNTATVNLIPQLVCYSPSNLLYMPLGNMPDVRICNIGNIQPREQRTIGSDTWQFFPSGRKLVSATGTDLATRNAGIAYLVT